MTGLCSCTSSRLTVALLSCCRCIEATWVGDGDPVDVVSRRDAVIQESYHRAFAMSAKLSINNGDPTPVTKLTNVKLYPSRDGKTTAGARGTRFKQMPPKDAP